MFLTGLQTVLEKKTEDQKITRIFLLLMKNYILFWSVRQVHKTKQTTSSFYLFICLFVFKSLSFLPQKDKMRMSA